MAVVFIACKKSIFNCNLIQHPVLVTQPHQGMFEGRGVSWAGGGTDVGRWYQWGRGGAWAAVRNEL